jgi:hypothetical protein
MATPYSKEDTGNTAQLNIIGIVRRFTNILGGVRGEGWGGGAEGEGWGVKEWEDDCLLNENVQIIPDVPKRMLVTQGS